MYVCMYVCISAIKISGRNQSGNKNYCPSNNLKERHVTHKCIRIFRNTLIRTNVSSLYKQHHQSKICLQKCLSLNNLHDCKNRHK